MSVLLNTHDILITIQIGRNLGYALPVKIKHDFVEKIKHLEALDCPNK